MHQLDNPSLLHQQVAEAIETLYATKDYADVLMYHWQAAGNGAQELHYALMVAEEMLTYSARYQQARQLLTHGMTLPPHPPSHLFYLLGRSEERMAHFAEAIAHYESSLAHVVDGDNIGQINALNGLASAHIYKSSFPQAVGYAEQALHLARQANYSQGIAVALNWLGSIAGMRGEYDQAQLYHEEALALRRTLGDQYGISVSLVSMGNLARQQRHYEQAQLYYDEALTIRRAIGDQQGIAVTLNYLGTIASLEAKYDQARLYLQEALSIHRTIGDPQGTAMALNHLGSLAGMRGLYDEAQPYYEEALAINRTIGRVFSIVINLLNLTFTQLHRHDMTVKPAIHELITLAVQVANPPHIVGSLSRVAWWQLNQGKPEQTAEYMGFILNHPACTKEVKEDVQPIMDELEAVLSSEKIAVAMERGKQMTMEEAIAQALNDLKNE